MVRYVMESVCRRVNESKKKFPWKFFRGDCHSHTQYSDGAGTVAETAEMAKAAGLDFQYVTDHWGVTHAPDCRKHGLWIGQEPVAVLHHLGILRHGSAFTPGEKYLKTFSELRHSGKHQERLRLAALSFLEDCAELKKRGAVTFIPHPTGWWPRRVYGKEEREVLEKLPSPFLMEICNGGGNVGSAFDFTDEAAIVLWDDLLNKGRVIHAMGNTDAHTPHGIGLIWNSVFAQDCRESSILKALSSGRSFVSDGPLVHIALGRARMGGKATPSDRRQVLKIDAVDVGGLMSERVIADGREIAAWYHGPKSVIRRTVRLPKTVRRYVRVELRSQDGRRAYSNPIYFNSKT